jgi:uncharacterized membrane protein
MSSDLFGNDTLRRLIRARLVKRELFAAMGISSVRRGTGHPCIVCARPIDSPMLAAILKHRPAV